MSQNLDENKEECSNNADPASLNKEGVSWLVFGRNNEAIACFKQALVAMKASLLAMPENTRLPLSTCPNPHKYESVSVPFEESRFYLYSRAAEFSSDNTGTVCERDYPLYSALILFNIGLAHHLQSSKEQGVQERALRDAAYFYTMCMQIIASIQPYFRKSTIAAIKIAALNNLAVVYYEQGNARKAHWILRDAYELLTPTLLQTEQETGRSFNQDDFDGITLNAVMTKWTFVAPCA